MKKSSYLEISFSDPRDVMMVLQAPFIISERDLLVKIKKYVDPVLFHSKVVAFLAKDEIENNLPLGVLASIIAGEYLETTPYMSLVESGGKPLLVMMCTPPHPVLFSYQETPPSQEHLQMVLVDLLETLKDNFTGITANKTMAAALMDAWEAMTGNKASLNMAMRIYKLDIVIPVRGVQGRLRSVNNDDRELLRDWYVRFLLEITGDEPNPARVGKWVKRSLANSEKFLRGLMIWEAAGIPVSMAGYSGPTPNGIRVGTVFTPEEHRTQGYASACTAGLCQYLLDQGFRFCFLFTDLLNPVSNHIYQKIGFEAVTDVDQYHFQFDEIKGTS